MKQDKTKVEVCILYPVDFIVCDCVEKLGSVKYLSGIYRYLYVGFIQKGEGLATHRRRTAIFQINIILFVMPVKMKATRSFEMMVSYCNSTHHHNLEDLHLIHHGCENLKSCYIYLCLPYRSL